MWGFETVIGCGLALVSLIVSVLTWMVGLSTATAPLCDLTNESNAKVRSSHWYCLVRKW